MQIEWLSKGTGDRVIIFFNGWGMDAQSVRHLKSDCDVVVISDYRNLAGEEPEADRLKKYSQTDVVAWSMGVWAAANLLSRWDIRPHRLVALNGTERPVDNQFGIPERIYRLTERGMNAAGREKFMSRMFVDEAERERFGACKPHRELQEVCDELVLIREQSEKFRQEQSWDKVYISEKDVIFVPEAQTAWWQPKTEHIEKLKGGHYPFYQFETWDQILTV